MDLALVVMSAGLGAIFLWGLVSPRTQWYAIVGWTRSDPAASEPGSSAYALSRFLSLVGVIVIVSMVSGWAIDGLRFARFSAREPTAAERIWGEPASVVVDRVFLPLSSVPEGLVPQKIDGFQSIDAAASEPRYLYETGRIRRAGLATLPGFLGVEPAPGRVALDTADLVVHVRGDDRCIPQSVAVIPVEGAVQIGVFFGQPNPADGSNSANVANCDPGPPIARTKGYLIPLDFSETLGDRVLQNLDGTPIVEFAPPPR